VSQNAENSSGSVLSIFFLFIVTPRLPHLFPKTPDGLTIIDIRDLLTPLFMTVLMPISSFSVVLFCVYASNFIAKKIGFI
jgi:hypothetical protein